MLLTVKYLKILPKLARYDPIFYFFALNWYIFIPLAYIKLLQPLQCIVTLCLYCYCSIIQSICCTFTITFFYYQQERKNYYKFFTPFIIWYKKLWLCIKSNTINNTLKLVEVLNNFCGPSSAKYFAPLRTRYPFIKSFVNLFVDIRLTSPDRSLIHFVRKVIW